jgi:hypothetical protein
MSWRCDRRIVLLLLSSLKKVEPRSGGVFFCPLDKGDFFPPQFTYCSCGNLQDEPLSKTPTPYGVRPCHYREVSTGVFLSGFSFVSMLCARRKSLSGMVSYRG